jgi:hypothetical protein
VTEEGVSPVDVGSVKINRSVDIPIEKIRPNTWNPNVQDPGVFNALVDHIVDVGFSGSVGVRPIPEDEREGLWEYEIVDGEHRYKAALILQMPLLPCTVYEDWDTDKAQVETIAFNVLAGKLDPLKFTAMFTKLSSKYGEDTVKRMMSFADEAAFNRAFRKVREQLPPDLQAKLDRSKSEVKTMEDLSVVLHDLMRKYGHTVEQSYVFFRYGGQTHLLVLMDPTLKRLLEKLTDQSAETKQDINVILAAALKRGMVDDGPDGRPN